MVLAWLAAADAAHAQDDAARDYDVPGGPLSAALARFAGQAGILLSVDAKLTEGKTATPLKGRYAVDEGIRRLLEGSGLEAVGDARSGYTVRRSRVPEADAGASVVLAGRSSAARDSLPDLNAPTVTVVARRDYEIGPMPGLALTKEQIPGNVQSVTSEDIRKYHSLNLGSVLNSQMQSVNINDYQGNPFQMDVTYRGFTASPQLGTPQGLSVFFDGIRVNEPFGDVVNWDLIPVNAISTVDMFPGSNPIFGLGTLGGAMSIRTKSGFTDPGATAEILGGSFGRKQLLLSAGSNNGTVAGFVAASLFDEDGWRDNSPSKVGQLFTKLEWRSDRTTLGFSTLLASTDLVGNGLIPLELYNERPESVFTSPDETRNKLLQLQLSAAFEVTDKFNITSQVYHRVSRRRSVNGDVYGAFDEMSNDYDYGSEKPRKIAAGRPPLCQYADTNHDGLPDYFLDLDFDGVPSAGEINAPYDDTNSFLAMPLPPLNNPTNDPAACDPSPVYDNTGNIYTTRNGKATDFRNGFTRQNGPGVVNGTPIGQINRTTIDQMTDGGAIQFNWNLDRHKFMAGASFDSAYAEYGSTSQLALIDPSHNVYLDPAHIDPLYFAASHEITNNSFDGRSNTGSLYFSETWSVLDNLHFTASARYNQTEVRNNLKSRTAAGFTELHNMRDFAGVPNIILCPTTDPASCPSMPNATTIIVDDARGNGNGYYRPSGKTGAQFVQGGEPEKFTYYSLNPSLGVSYLPVPVLDLYANWSQGTRTPSVIELGCAFDPNPATRFGGACTLPSTLSGDPYLPQIEAITNEVGVRGKLAGDWRWNASVYRTDLRNDIYFVAFTPTQNYFDNIGRTRRQGLELGVSGSAGRWDFGLNYAFTQATFQSAFWQSNLSNSSTDRDPNGGSPPGQYPFVEDPPGSGSGTVVVPPQPGHVTNHGVQTWRLYKVSPGDRMPGIPEHTLNLNIGYRLTDAWSASLNMIARSSAYSRGNENNDHQPGPGQGDKGQLSCDTPLFDPDTGDFTGYFQCNGTPDRPAGQPYLYDGKTPGYAIFNFETTYRVDRNLSVSFLVANLFDRKYYTASRLGQNPFSPSINGAIGPSGFNYNSADWLNTTFVAPGPPRGFFLSLTYEFGVDSDER
ncbi:MAG TPA: TonB-dependent receptor [Burkholderiales bacterium]|nr:TonB-dependent receptor [Burkholderiales bacterium]